MPNFEKFTRSRAKWGGAPRVSVTKQGLLSFNASCIDKHIKDYAWAELHYDRRERLIGLKLLKEERPDVYKIRRNRNDRFVYLSAMGFLKYFGIPHQKTKPCTVTWDERGKMLVVNLKT